MSAIIRRSSFFFITHFLTLFMFSWRRGATAFCALLVFIWLPSSVLWSERGESYAFLRLLPVRDRDVARAKLGLGLGAAAAYWAWLTLVSLIHWGVSREFFALFSLVNLAASVWMPLVALCYLGVWRIGARAMTFPLLTLMVIAFFAALGFGLSYFPPRRVYSGLAAAPWPLQILLPLAGLGLFLLLARKAPRVKWNNDEHLQMP
jgi:hypothetical protein